MSGHLISPRVRVLWKDINLSAYNGKEKFPQGAPLVYDVEIDLQAESNSPTGTMKWDPTGPGFAVYEKFLSSKEYMTSQIVVEYFYPKGKKITFVFVWAGQSISYGNDMTVTVSLKTELDGLINGNIRNFTQAYDEKKGGTYIDSLNKGIEQYKIPDKKIIQYNETAKKDLEKAKIQTNYGQDQTFGSFVANTVQQNGNRTFANNIGKANLAIMPPYSWDQKVEVLNAAEADKTKSPDPTKRYGFLLGPSNIQTIQRQSQWQPPQQNMRNTPNTQVRARDPKTGQFLSNAEAIRRGIPIGNSTTTTTGSVAALSAEEQTQATAKPSSAVLGTANARPNPGIRNLNNPDGPTKQNLLNQEATSSLSLQTMLTPVFVGIKPYDILFIPSLKGDFIEDWQVESVGYDQNDGQIMLSVQAKRTLGLGVPMVKGPAEKFLKYAKEKGLVGPSASLENWDKYTWGAIDRIPPQSSK